MKCYGLMIHDDGTAMVGECPEEMAEQMMAGGMMQDVASLEEGLSRLAEMAMPADQSQADDESAMSRGFAKARGMGGMMGKG